MILPAHFAKLAAQGRATVALIPVTTPRKVTRGGKTGWKVPRPGKGTSYKTTPWTPRTGSHETLRSNTGRKVTAVADIVIGAHRTMTLGDLLDDTPAMLQLVRATGCSTRAEFAREWMRHSDRDWPPTEEALCPRCGGTNKLDREWRNPITQTLVLYTIECPDCDEVGTIQVDTFPSDTEILDRFKRKHARLQVYLVHFNLDGVEHRRLLSPAGRPRGDDLGYTENPSDAIQDAGEAVPPNYQAVLAKDASARDEKARQARGEGRDMKRAKHSADRAEKYRRAA